MVPHLHSVGGPFPRTSKWVMSNKIFIRNNCGAPATILVRKYFSKLVQPRQIQIAPHRAETQDGSEHVCLDRQLGRNALRYALVRRTLVRWAAWWLHGDAPARSSIRRARLRSAAGLRRYAFRSSRRCGVMGPDLCTWCGVNTEGEREFSSCLSIDTRPCAQHAPACMCNIALYCRVHIMDYNSPCLPGSLMLQSPV